MIRTPAAVNTASNAGVNLASRSRIRNVPAQEGTRRDDQAQLAELAAGQQPGQRGQGRPIGPGQPRSLDLTLQNSNLVSQDQA